MKYLMIMFIGCLLIIGGCTTVFTSSQLAAFQKTCSAARTGYTVFSTLKETGRFSANTINRVDAAWAGVNSVCVNPPADVSTAAVQVAAALVIIMKAVDNG